MPSALWWKRFYEEERARMDLDALVANAPEVELGAVSIFPHTRLSTAGWIVAAIAKAVVRTRCDTVLAIGVLHGARERDVDLVKRAKSGDADASKILRRVHEEDGHASEEFSLDAFRALVEVAAKREGVRSPIVHARYPFLVGDRPHDLPGLDDLAGDVVVGTTDPVHHGIGYGTSPALSEDEAPARSWIESQTDALARADFSEFQRLCERHKSDFRDVGPTIATRFPKRIWTLHELALVDYSDVFECARPTWVAAGRITL